MSSGTTVIVSYAPARLAERGPWRETSPGHVWVAFVGDKSESCKIDPEQARLLADQLNEAAGKVEISRNVLERKT
jgi:hypothetical protein